MVYKGIGFIVGLVRFREKALPLSPQAEYLDGRQTRASLAVF